MIAIGVGGIPDYARLVRGEVLSLLERDDVRYDWVTGATRG